MLLILHKLATTTLAVRADLQQPFTNQGVSRQIRHHPRHRAQVAKPPAT